MRSRKQQLGRLMAAAAATTTINMLLIDLFVLRIVLAHGGIVRVGKRMIVETRCRRPMFLVGSGGRSRLRLTARSIHLLMNCCCETVIQSRFSLVRFFLVFCCSLLQSVLLAQSLRRVQGSAAMDKTIDEKRAALGFQRAGRPVRCANG